MPQSLYMRIMLQFLVKEGSIGLHVSPEEVILVPQHNLFHVFADISNVLQRYLRTMLHFCSGKTPTHAYFVVAQAQHLVHHAGVSVTRHVTALFTPNKKQKTTTTKNDL